MDTTWALTGLAGTAATLGEDYLDKLMGRHHSEQLLLDLALLMERARPWLLVAPGSPR